MKLVPLRDRAALQRILDDRTSDYKIVILDTAKETRAPAGPTALEEFFQTNLNSPAFKELVGKHAE